MKSTRSILLRSLALTALLAAPALVVVACDGSNVPIGSDQQKIACNVDSQCAPGQACVNGFCAGAGGSGGSGTTSATTGSGCVPSAETCNGIDDDCDGTVDDGATCAGGASCIAGACVMQQDCNVDSDCPPNQSCQNGACAPLCQGAGQPCSSNVGACQPGVTQCMNGAVVCVGGVLPSAEACNGIDDDCDGAVDNAAICPNGGSCVNGVCGAPPPCNSNADCGPSQVCNNGVCGPANCVPQAEACNGLDDDCDGTVDNAAICPNGGSCVNGACVMAQACNTDADCPPNQSCQNGACAPICPGAGQPCSFNLGACKAGTTQCMNGAIICAGGVLPSAEVCNGIDDDCDGVVDNAASCGFGKSCVNGACQ